MTGPGYRELVAWKRAIDLVEQIYRVTNGWPPSELYGITNQVRRAAVSLPANIAEGQGRTSPKEFAHHLSIAYGSLCEVETHRLIANRLMFIDSPTFDTLIEQTTSVAKPLRGLIRKFQ